jgi:hypothetical protein
MRNGQDFLVWEMEEADGELTVGRRVEKDRGVASGVTSAPRSKESAAPQPTSELHRSGMLFLD